VYGAKTLVGGFDSHALPPDKKIKGLRHLLIPFFRALETVTTPVVTAGITKPPEGFNILRGLPQIFVVHDIVPVEKMQRYPKRLRRTFKTDGPFR
jgi:hypothetical protein